MNPIVDLLTRAKARTLAHPCKGASARSADGCSVPSRSPNAVRWCSYGALDREAHDTTEFLAVCVALERAAESFRPPNKNRAVAWVNDEHPDLIPQMFDLAIEEASK